MQQKNGAVQYAGSLVKAAKELQKVAAPGLESWQAQLAQALEPFKGLHALS